MTAADHEQTIRQAVGRLARREGSASGYAIAAQATDALDALLVAVQQSVERKMARLRQADEVIAAAEARATEAEQEVERLMWMEDERDEARALLDAARESRRLYREERDEARAEALRYRGLYEASVADQRELVEARAENERLTRQIAGIREWFHGRPWVGSADGSSFGCGAVTGEYTPNERALGYGTYRDPRFLPSALAAAQEPPTDGGDRRG